MAELHKVVGTVDDLRRPIVRIEVPGREGFLAIVDTGFNGALLLMAAEAIAMGFEISDEIETVELGTSARTSVRRGLGTVQWLGRSITVNAFISTEPIAINIRPDVARALIGTELMAGCLLLVDFPDRIVEIEQEH